MIGTLKNLTLYAKRLFISGPYKQARVYVTEQWALTEISDLGKTVTISDTHGTWWYSNSVWYLLYSFIFQLVDRHVWLSKHCMTFLLSFCFGPKYPFGSPVVVVVFQVDNISVPSARLQGCKYGRKEGLLLQGLLDTRAILARDWQKFQGIPMCSFLLGAIW